MEQAAIKDAISGGSGEDSASGSLTPRQGKKLDESLIVRCRLIGETLLAVTHGDLEWPDEDRALSKGDVLSLLKIPIT